MKILFIGASWRGSDARGLREALGRVPGAEVEDVGVDLFIPMSRSRLLRAVHAAIRPLQLGELKQQVRRTATAFRPEVIVVFKGWHFDAAFIRELQNRFAPVVNIFPDASPHAHGATVKEAMGVYDLVISRKRHHPRSWRSIYGYDNLCVHVPHGYTADVHLREHPPRDQPYDVTMVANGRPEYTTLMKDIVRLCPPEVKFAIAGDNWSGRGLEGFPNVELFPAPTGRSYVDRLRMAKIAIAHVQSVVLVEGEAQPGDQVSARTFECAAANIFFVHRRTDEVELYYDELKEVPMYSGPDELAEKIGHFLQAPHERHAMAAAAHARAVPAYSIDARAAEIYRLLDEFLT